MATLCHTQNRGFDTASNHITSFEIPKVLRGGGSNACLQQILHYILVDANFLNHYCISNHVSNYNCQLLCNFLCSFNKLWALGLYGDWGYEHIKKNCSHFSLIYAVVNIPNLIER